MKKLKLFSVLILSGLLAVSCSENEILNPADDASSTLGSETFAKGNDAPSGAHYNLNIIGTKDKSADMTGGNAHRIFVPLWGHGTKIMLTEGNDFRVIDGNGTDGTAEFQLPNPNPYAGTVDEDDWDGVSSYSIWMRALGTPGGKAVITTCADADLDGGYYEVCSAESVTVERTKGVRSKFTNVSKTLLTIYIDTTFTFNDSNGNPVEVKAGRYPIFDDTFEDYFWKYDNDGLRLLQLRFYYNEPTDIMKS